MKRRKFIAGSAAAVVASGVVKPNLASAANRFRWKLASTWPPGLPIYQEAADMFSKIVEKASDGRLKIKVFAGGELIPPLQVFDAVSSGTIEMGVGAAYYWAGKVPATPFFTTIPFGLNPQQQNAWLYSGGGLELWRELYAPFNLVPMPLGNTGIQMAGWYKNELKSLKDLKGLKIRMPGIGGQVMSQLGSTVVLLPGSEVYTALERGTIDATEWIGPFLDERLGLYRAAKNYYYPAWHEPGAILELSINKSKWDTLPKDLQEIVSSVAAHVNLWTLCESEAKNGPALERLVTQHKVQLRDLPVEILEKLKEVSKDVVADLAKQSPLATKINKSYQDFQTNILPWSKVSERAYFNT